MSIITRGSVWIPDTDFWVFAFDLGISTNKGKISTSGKSRNLLEDQEKLGKFDVFWKKSGKSKWRRCKFLTFKKRYACRNVCSWIVYDNQLYIWCYYLHLVLRWFNIANPFYFNLSEVFFNLDQERKLHAINCVLFFAKAFISSKWRRWKFLTFKKRYACRNVCSWIVYDNQLYIKCYYLHLVLRWFNIANPFYFNLILTKKENFTQ